MNSHMTCVATAAPIRIALFVDGGLYRVLNSYYRDGHPVGQPLNFGAMEVILRRGAKAAMTSAAIGYQGVAKRYFDGNPLPIRGQAAMDGARRFDALIANWGWDVHRQDMNRFSGKQQGVDVDLAVSAVTLAHSGAVDVIVFLTTDGDFAPLFRKIRSTGVTVVLAAWDVTWNAPDGMLRCVKTSPLLAPVADYVFNMGGLINEMLGRGEADGLFYGGRRQLRPTTGVSTKSSSWLDAREQHRGTVVNMGDRGFGFIRPDTEDERAENIYFDRKSVRGGKYPQMKLGDRVVFYLGQNHLGPCAVEVHLLPLRNSEGLLPGRPAR